MKKLLIIIGAICYVVAPDLFFGPVDDAVVFLGSMIYAIAVPGANRDRDPEYIRMDRDFWGAPKEIGQNAKKEEVETDAGESLEAPASK